MSHRRLCAAAVVSAMALSFIVTCQSDPSDPPACNPIAALVDAGTPDFVWGFADLHAHAGIESAFNQRLIWGTALDPQPVNGSELPMIDPCPVETHDKNASSPLDHKVGSLVFPKLAIQSSFAHGPVGDLTVRTSHAWPNARDIIHQQMNVSSIRRAYEGGLRLMFASTTDDQVIDALLEGPNMINAFVPDPESDYNSARAQLETIQQIVEQNHDWMDIAKHARDARRIIGQGKLAIVLSLEMNGLSEADVDKLVAEFGVAHIIPVHLIDNDVGGTAATSDLFNASSSLVSALYRSDGLSNQYIDIQGTTTYTRELGWPFDIVTLNPPVYANISMIPYAEYSSSSVCYEPLSQCSGSVPAPTSYVEIGHQNFRGLCTTKAECQAGIHPGEARIRHYMGEHLFVDLSHMSANAVEQTLGIDAGLAGGFPFIASHGDFALVHPGDGPSNERNLAGAAARKVIAQGGVLGLGAGLGGYGTRTIVTGRGGPLLSFNQAGATTGCLAAGGTGEDAGTTGCQPAIAVGGLDDGTPITQLTVRTSGGISSVALNGHPYVRVELDGPDATSFQHRVLFQPLECSDQSCEATVSLGSQAAPVTVPDGGEGCTTPYAGPLDGGTPFVASQIELVTLEWQYLECDVACQQAAGAFGTNQQCQNTWASGPTWTIENADLTATTAAGSTAPLAHIASASGAPISVLGQSNGSLVVFQKSDRPDPSVQASGKLYRITMVGSTELEGASPSSTGVNVCAALRTWNGPTCAPAPPPPPGSVDCPSGWVSMNQRGEWQQGISLYAFARTAGPESAICGVDVALLDWTSGGTTWTIDQISAQVMSDPLASWIQGYADDATSIAGSQAGRIAFGTDFNGLNGLLELSENGLPAGALTASACPVAGDTVSPDAGPLAMAPMRFRHSDGTLGDPVLIDERGLGTYGLLADMLAIIEQYPRCGRAVHDSLMMSAEGTIRAWEAIENQTTAPAMPTMVFDCSMPADAGIDDAGPTDATVDAGSSDAADAGAEASP